MHQLKISILLTSLLMTGCASLGSKNVSMEHASYKELISQEFSDELWIPVNNDGGPEINIFATGKANAPKDSLSKYCARDGGVFSHIYTDKNVSSKHKKVKSITGVFSCNKNNNIIWMAQIDAKNEGYNGGNPGYVFKVKDYSVVEYQSNISREKARVASLEQAKIKLKNDFISQTTAQKSKGDSICSWDNKFGYVEDISNDKIKILIKGKITRSQKGFFFNGIKQQVNRSKQEELIWDKSANWGGCGFII
jgi:hypothetical protein